MKPPWLRLSTDSITSALQSPVILSTCFRESVYAPHHYRVTKVSGSLTSRSQKLDICGLFCGQEQESPWLTLSKTSATHQPDHSLICHSQVREQSRVQDNISLSKGGRQGEEKCRKKGLKRSSLGKEVHTKPSTEPQGAFSDRRRPFSPGKRQGSERKDILQAVQHQAKVAACAAITPILEAFLEADVSITRGREKGEGRRISGQGRLSDWACGHCGCRDADQFPRDGHSRRDLCTSWRKVSERRMPMLECQTCQHDVRSHVAM